MSRQFRSKGPDPGKISSSRFLLQLACEQGRRKKGEKEREKEKGSL